MGSVAEFLKSACIVSGLVVGIVGLAGVTSDARATTIQIAQESSLNANDFDSNILGVINPFSTSLSTSDFYSFGSSSYNGNTNGGPSPLANTTQLFMLDASDGLSLIVIHDGISDGSGGNANETWTLTGGDTASVLVSDDGTEASATSSTVFDTNFLWASCCTDGYAIGSLDGDWTMIGGFNSFSNISTWQAVSSGFSDIPLTLATSTTTGRVRLQTIPEPGTMGLVLMGLIVLARRRRVV